MGAVDRCCCEEDCPIFYDDYDPPCDGDLDEDVWDVISGTATVVDDVDGGTCSSQGQVLRLAADTVIICKTHAPHHQYTVEHPIGNDANSIPGLVLNASYNPTTGVLSSYDYAEYDVFNQTINLGHNNGSIDTEVTSISAPGGLADLIAYINDSTLSAGWEGDCHNDGTWICSGSNARYVGLRNRGATHNFPGGAAGGFNFQQHTDAYDSCGDCDCQCEEICIERTLTGVVTLLSGTDACCGDAEGSWSFLFDVNDEDVPCSWEGQFPTGLPPGSYCGYSHQFKFTRPTGNRKPTYDLFGLSDDGGYPGISGLTLEEGSCDPPYWRYTYTVEYPGDPACEFQLEIGQ